MLHDVKTHSLIPLRIIYDRSHLNYLTFESTFSIYFKLMREKQVKVAVVKGLTLLKKECYKEKGQSYQKMDYKSMIYIYGELLYCNIFSNLCAFLFSSEHTKSRWARESHSGGDIPTVPNQINLRCEYVMC